MYRMVFVENVLLHGQNEKESKKVRVLGIFKRDPGGCFLDPHKKLNYFCIIFFFFNRREILSSLIYNEPLSSYKRKVGKSLKMSKFFGHQKLSPTLSRS